MSTDSPALAPAPVSTRRDEARARRLRAELEAKDREIRELREQLRTIHTSDAWAIVRTLWQLRQAVAPPGTGRDRLAAPVPPGPAAAQEAGRSAGPGTVGGEGMAARVRATGPSSSRPHRRPTRSSACR